MPDEEPAFEHSVLHLLVETKHGHVEIINDHRMHPAEIRRQLQKVKDTFGTGKKVDLPWFTASINDVVAAWTTSG